MLKKKPSKELSKYIIRREKRLLSVPYEITKDPNLREIYFNAICKSLPTVLVVKPEFFKDKEE